MTANPIIKPHMKFGRPIEFLSQKSGAGVYKRPYGVSFNFTSAFCLPELHPSGLQVYAGRRTAGSARNCPRARRLPFDFGELRLAIGDNSDRWELVDWTAIGESAGEHANQPILICCIADALSRSRFERNSYDKTCRPEQEGGSPRRT